MKKKDTSPVIIYESRGVTCLRRRPYSFTDPKTPSQMLNRRKFLLALNTYKLVKHLVPKAYRDWCLERGINWSLVIRGYIASCCISYDEKSDLLSVDMESVEEYVSSLGRIKAE